MGRSVIVIEHDMEFVKLIASKVSVLHQGKLLAAGTMRAFRMCVPMRAITSTGSMGLVT